MTFYGADEESGMLYEIVTYDERGLRKVIAKDVWIPDRDLHEIRWTLLCSVFYGIIVWR